jgi:hypothetical protein
VPHADAVPLERNKHAIPKPHAAGLRGLAARIALQWGVPAIHDELTIKK